MERLRSTIFITLMLGLAYAVSGWVSLNISVPPYYVSQVFLAAGVALGAAMVWGGRAAPGIWLGSFLVQWLASGMPRWVDWSLTMMVSPLAATTQAFLAAYLARRWTEYPGNLDRARSTVLFMLVVVPLIHILNASVSVPLLVRMQVVAVPDAWFNWWIWWQGDALGAALGTPLMLVAFGQPAASWRPRWRTVLLPMLMAMAVVLTAFAQILSNEERARGQRFEQEAAALTERLQRRLDAQTDAVMAVTRLKELTDGEDANVFRATTTNWLSRHAGTQNFGWSPWVTDARRPAFEQMGRELHTTLGDVSRYEIRGRDSTGTTHTAPQAGHYLPILFVEPLATNKAVLGLDVLVLPATAKAVQAALESGLPQVTEGIRLVQETGEQRGVVMYQAAFRPSQDGHGAKPVRGVVSAVFRMDDVLAAALDGVDPNRLVICLLDPSAPVNNQRLSGPAGCADTRTAGTSTARHFVSTPVNFGERQWRLHVQAGPLFGRQERGWTTWGTLTVSLVAVAMLGVFLIVQTGQARRTEELVIERTKELALSNEGLKQLALFDPLTGLANRVHWLNEAATALEAARRHNDQLAVLFVDLDHFKDVNDSLGHNVGDQLLIAVAQRLQSCLRNSDLMARQGGDEFVVLLNRMTDRQDAARVAAKMIETLAPVFPLQGHDIQISVSVGVALLDPDTQDVDTLLRHADMAMYRAKNEGRNGWRVFVPEMEQGAAQRLLVEGGLRRAMAQNELLLHYQPQVDCATGQVVGVEALLRWQHPQWGLVMPDRFVPQAESSGQIDELGSWVMRRAMQQWKTWRDAGITGLTMAVNVSAMEFGRPSFVPRLRELLDETGADPDWMELEITETALMQALPELLERLGDITRMGVRLSLDDFGTGYSSLGYLKRLPLQSVKIDRSFIRDVPGDKEDAAIVCATLSMARALGLQVVAEGVELAEQREFLAEQGCSLIQGWLVSRPMAAEAFEAWWRARHQAPHLGHRQV